MGKHAIKVHLKIFWVVFRSCGELSHFIDEKNVVIKNPLTHISNKTKRVQNRKNLTKNIESTGLCHLKLQQRLLAELLENFETKLLELLQISTNTDTPHHMSAFLLKGRLGRVR